nr:ribosomal protein S19 [Schizostauron trachyderma]
MSRSKWKGPYINPKYIKKLNKKKPNIISRNTKIIPKFVDLTFKIHNGKSYIELLITEDMLGHKFGEFIFTRSKFEFKKKSKK